MRATWGRLSSLISPWARGSSIIRRIAGGVSRLQLWPSTHASKSASRVAGTRTKIAVDPFSQCLISAAEAISARPFLGGSSHHNLVMGHASAQDYPSRTFIALLWRRSAFPLESLWGRRQIAAGALWRLIHAS